MGYITTISLPPPDFDDYLRDPAKPYTMPELHPTSTINIFVGANNSGKSRFARLLARRVQYAYGANDTGINAAEIQVKVTSIVDELLERLPNGTDSLGQCDVSVLRYVRHHAGNYSRDSDLQGKFQSILQTWRNLRQEFELVPELLVSNTERYDLRQDIREICENAYKTLPRFDTIAQPERIYIPILRGLRSISETDTDRLNEIVKAEYFTGGAPGPNEIFTGQNMYANFRSMLLGDQNQRAKAAAYERFLSKELYEGTRVQLIPRERDTRQLHVKIGREEEKQISQLGDGVQAAILLTYPVFFAEKRAMFFIEEPEMFMHPGLQRKVLDYFASEKQHMFFLTTHSNHFLDLSIDIRDVSIFTFQKRLDQDELNTDQNAQFIVTAVSHRNLSCLELLGVRNSSVFLVNATIWVEGITDRWYYRKFLDLYMKQDTVSPKLEEDVHYSFVEYGGANITHWSFLDDEDNPINVDCFCSKAMLIIDQDGERKQTRKDKLQSKLEDRLVVIQCREVENLLPFSVIHGVVADYEGPEATVLPINAPGVYASKQIAVFIEDEVLGGDPKRSGGYKDPGGVLKNKRAFCTKAMDQFEELDVTFEQLPPAAQDVATRMYKFIRDQNMPRANTDLQSGAST